MTDITWFMSCLGIVGKTDLIISTTTRTSYQVEDGSKEERKGKVSITRVYGNDHSLNIQVEMNSQWKNV